MPYYETKTARYHYVKKGKGQPVIFAHGLFVDHSIFDYQVEKLQENYTCYSFDLPGHGLSTYNATGWTLEDIVEDFYRFCKELNLQKPAFIGLSQGGMIFSRLAVKYPELVGCLVLVGSSHLAEFPERIPIWNRRIQLFENGTQEEIGDMIAEIQELFLSQHFIDNFPELKKKELMIMQNNKPEAMVLATKAAVTQRTDVANLSNIVCPTLLVCGTDDHATPINVAEQMLQGINNSCLKIIANAGHHVPIEAQGVFCDTLIQFLNNNKR